MSFSCQIVLLLVSVSMVKSFTGVVKMDSCYDTTRRGYGFRVTNGPIVSKVNCTMYFEAPDSQLYTAVRLNQVNLAKIGNSCPQFTVFHFSSWREDPVPDRWKGSEVIVPADPSVMMTCNCTNYLSRCSNLQFFETNSPNLKIMLTYNPDDVSRTIKRQNAFDVTISSYRREASSGCEKGYFGCWHYRHKCIPDTLKCDGYDNCFDNSDEFDYTCTGRIAEMTLPVFVLMILACVIAMCLIIWIVVALIRRRQARARLERNEWGEVIKSNPQYPPQYAQQYPQQYAQQYPDDPYGTGGGSMQQQQQLFGSM